MAIPLELTRGLSPAEIEFIAENELITIEPMVRTQSLELIQGTYAPLQPQPPKLTQVPIWMALVLRKRNQCRIVPPDWLTVEFLSKKLEEEQEDAPFSALPLNYMEIGHLLLDSAMEDIPRSAMVRRLLKDLREIRQAKARLGLTLINGNHMQMDNIGWMELNEIRPFFTKAFEQLQQLEPEEQ
ncbi:hypothetical protein BDF22DRAFT_747025 [Syncephalis plumigaleata]|nr:hypothetical protein BDF22DRAFT_747025 [Syncephalis plumigaleata]